MADQNETLETADNKLHAKDISKIFKFIAPAFVVICAVLKWVGLFANADITEIMKVGAFIYASGAGTIDLNLIIDKFTGKGAAYVGNTESGTDER